MSSRFGSALLLAAVAWRAPAQATTRQDSAIVAKALDSVRSFHRFWEQQWVSGQRTQMHRVGALQGPVPKFLMAIGPVVRDPRGADLACDWSNGPPYESDHQWGVRPGERKIHSKGNNVKWVCPNWLPPPDYYLSQAGLGDERESIDNALELVERNRVIAQRRLVILELRAAVSAAPQDSVLVGQYIRMLVDNRELLGALNAVEQCRASRPWCLALEGYVYQKMGETDDAERAFRGSLAAQTERDRCAFTRIGVLFPDDDRKAYLKSSCAAQDSVNQRTWWLAHPLWSIAGNDRLTEQFTRKVTIALHAALGRDERYNWSYLGGGDALAEMVERYGWMSYVYLGTRPRITRFPPVQPNAYGGTPKDLPEKVAARALRGFQTTYEYSIGRVHVIPTAAMLRDPFSITNDDWSLNAPAGTSWDYTFKWWPEEHYSPIHPLITLRDQQTAYLRRQDNSLLAFSTALGHTDINRRLGDSVSAAFVVSTGPDAIHVLARRRVGAQDRLTFLNALPTAPALVSIEVPWGPAGERAARSRFAVKAPPPLSQMRAGETAMSDPILLAVPAGATALPNLADSAVALMHGSATLAAGSNEIGVYWETYGIRAGDSVEVTIGVQRKGGVVDRVTSVVGALGNSNSLVTASWFEPNPGYAVRNVPGAVPIQMRSVVLNISAVPVGTYTLEISVKKKGVEPLKSSREFTIR